MFNLARADGGYLVSHECMQPPNDAQKAHQPYRAMGKFDSALLTPHVQRRLVREVMRHTFAYVPEDGPASEELGAIANKLCAKRVS